MTLRRDAQGLYHVDQDDRLDIHGSMDDQDVISWMTNVIHNFAHVTAKAGTPQ